MYGFSLQDEKVVAFQDIKPAALRYWMNSPNSIHQWLHMIILIEWLKWQSCRHYLVIPLDHIPTVNDLQRRPEDYSLGKSKFCFRLNDPWLNQMWLLFCDQQLLCFHSLIPTILFYLVSHMLEVGKTLLQRDAPQCHRYRYIVLN